jgi:uncharacterized protein with PIN domain
MKCNEILNRVPREAVLDRIPAKVREHYSEFHICPGCGRVYWPGTHYERMAKMIRQCRVQSLRQNLVPNKEA